MWKIYLHDNMYNNVSQILLKLNVDFYVPCVHMQQKKGTTKNSWLKTQYLHYLGRLWSKDRWHVCTQVLCN